MTKDKEQLAQALREMYPWATVEVLPPGPRPLEDSDPLVQANLAARILRAAEAARAAKGSP